MKDRDEPLFNLDSHEPVDSLDETDAPTLQQCIRRLVEEQPYAVLCVQGKGQPYGALVAFAFTRDLRQAVFATPVATRKFQLLSHCSHVALVIDNRANKVDELMEIEAVTVTGIASLIENRDDYQQWTSLLVARHPYLKSFVSAASCALFSVDVVRFLHVVRLQEVRQWIPNAPL